MGIAIVAPENFRFQDLACIDIALRFEAFDDRTLVPEPKGGEDAVLEFTRDGASKTLEIQVKNEAGDLTVERLAEFLAHFPDRTASGSLLERLILAPNAAAAFVIGARAVDALARLRVSPDFRGLPPASEPSESLAKVVIAALGKMAAAVPGESPPSGLTQRRRLACAALAARGETQLAEALTRVLILDNQREADFEVRLRQKLLQRGVPADRLRDGLTRLRHALEASKRPQTNALPAIEQALAALAPPAIRPRDYIERGEENAQVLKLSLDHVLLLSGAPRAGKTYLARRLGGELQAHGFEVRSSGHIDEADRFLLTGDSTNRAYILEDPFGQRQGVSDLAARVSALRILISQVPHGARLIVTQSEGPLRQHFGVDDPFEWGFGGFDWTIVGAPELAVARAIWRQSAEAAGIQIADRDRVDALIETRSDLRSAGGLAFLASNFDHLPAEADDDALVQQAHGDAADYARVLAEDSNLVRDILVGLAVSTEPGIDIGREDLTFVVQGGDERPSFATTSYVVELLSRDETSEQPPAYDFPPVMTADNLGGLRRLVDRRVVQRSGETSNFAHPYYRAGAQALISPTLIEDVAASAAPIARALSACSPATSLSAARNLGWLSRRLGQQPTGLATVAELAAEGLTSKFPATRDACFEFLMRVAPELGPSRLEDIQQWIRLVDVDIDQVIDIDGVSFIPDIDVSFRRSSERIAVDAVQPFLTAIDEGRPIGLDFPLARQLLKALAPHPELLSRAVAERLLSADEAVVRAEAAKTWLCRPRIGDAEFISRLARDISPTVAVATLDALVEAWPVVDDDRRVVILRTLEAQAGSPGAATVLIQRLGVFDRVEHFGETPPWPVFSQVAAAALANLPRGVWLNDGRLINALDEAVRLGEGERLEPLFEVWVERLEQALEHGDLPSETELAIIPAIVKAAGPGVRLRWFERLLAADSTGARMRFITNLTSEWAHLTEDERTLVRIALASRRGDEVWLQAAVLTSHAPPTSLIQQIAGAEGIRSSS